MVICWAWFVAEFWPFYWLSYYAVRISLGTDLNTNIASNNGHEWAGGDHQQGLALERPESWTWRYGRRSEDGQ